MAAAPRWWQQCRLRQKQQQQQLRRCPDMCCPPSMLPIGFPATCKGLIRPRLVASPPSAPVSYPSLPLTH